MNKIFNTILKFSVSSLLLGGCVSSDVLKKKNGGNVFCLDEIPLEESAKHYHFSRSFYSAGPDIYKSDLLFVLNCAKEKKKEYFEFDGSVYRADDTAVLQLEALVKARQKVKKTLFIRGRKDKLYLIMNRMNRLKYSEICGKNCCPHNPKKQKRFYLKRRIILPCTSL